MRRLGWAAVILVAVMLGAFACSASEFEVTRVVELEVTREIEVPVEVIREVGTVREVEVTREVEVIREIEVEVTREVDSPRVVTRVVEVIDGTPTTPTPTPSPTNTPAAPTPVEAPDLELIEPHSFGPGTHLVGEDIQPGLYRAEVANSFFPLCTWSRLSGLDGSLSSIIATKIINEGFTYVRIKETDLAFESSGCTEFTLHQPGTSPAEQFGPGMYLVRSDIHAGLYKSEAGGGLLPFCSWSRLRDVDGSFGSVIATDIVLSGQALVEIDGTDFAFESSGCQTWELQGEPAIAPSEPPNARVATASPTAIFSPTNTPTVTATVPSASVHTPTGTATPTATSLPTVTATPTSESTPTATQIPTPSPGPTDTPTPTATPSPTPEPPSTPGELVERVQNSVVRVKARTGGYFFRANKPRFRVYLCS